tara:strand:+ start:103 stop:300 length:198 start_codon:yes stop_codon:yes gene_type:complete
MTDTYKIMKFIGELQQEKSNELIDAKEEMGEPTDDDYLVASTYAYIEGEQSALNEVVQFILKENK